MNTLQLIEALTDISTDNKLYHYTNIYSLFGILKNKKIKGFEYPSNTVNSKKPEVAVARKAAITDKKNFSNLSASIGNVAITLYTDRIKSNVRNVSIKPIAELPLESKRRLESILKNIVKPEDIKKVIQYIEKNLSSLSLENEGKVAKRIHDNFETISTNEKDFTKLFKGIMEFKVNVDMGREGEERIGIPDSIPVKPELMQISIKPLFKNDWALILPKSFIFGRKAMEYKNLLLENKDLFVQDAVFNRLITTLDKLSTMSPAKACDFLRLDPYDKERVFFHYNIK